MYSSAERLIAFRYLRPRRKEGFVSVIAGFSLLGIALGVGTLIVVMAVMNGFRQELLQRILGLNGHIGIYAQFGGSVTHYDALVGQLGKVEGVVHVAPLVEGQVMASANGVARGAVVHGLRPADFAARDILARNITQGHLADFGGDDSVIIGSRLADRLGLKIGDPITLISPRVNRTAFGAAPRLRAYQVAATFDIGMYEYDSSFIFMPLKAAQIYFKTGPEAVTGLEVLTTDPVQIDQAVQRLSAFLGPQYRVLSWQQANAGFFNAIQVERNVMFLILTLIILVAAFNIVSSMIMLVKDKSMDIAVLRSLGATRGSILRIFILSGAMIGVVGTALGFTAGLAFAKNIEAIRRWLEALTGGDLFSAEIYFLSQLPAVVDPVEVAAVTAMGLGLSFLATLYPAWRAATLDPVEVLRYG